jgi:hypothetical protein
MGENFRCDCGNDEFWYFMHDTKISCTKCYTEYRVVFYNYYKKIYKRNFNKKTNKYEEWILIKNEKIEQ